MPAQPNQSLGHGIAVLQALALAHGPIGSRELARRLGMDHTRANRMLGTLADLGLAARTSDRAYVPGPGIHVLAAQALHGSRLIQTAWPLIRDELSDVPVVAVGVLWRDQICYLLYGNPRKPLEQLLAGHELYPAADSSIGALLLAATATTSQAATIRQRGWAVNDAASGARSLAVAIGSPAVAGLATAPVSDDTNHAVLVERLLSVAERISSGLRRS